MNTRLKISLLLGVGLGLICILGVGFRLGIEGNKLFLLGVWLNRVILGLIIGLAGNIYFIKFKGNTILRGLIFGLLVSFSLAASTDFKDVPGFVAGIIYGPIIDLISSRYEKLSS